MRLVALAKVERVGIRADHPLGQSVRLREKEPVPVGEPEAQVGEPQGIAGRDDVEDGELRHALGVVEGQPVGAAGAAVVPADRKPFEAVLPHQLDLVARHRPFRVRLMIRRRLRLRALAVAPQVGSDDGEPVGQIRGHRVPHQVRLRMAMQKQERRAAAAVADPQRRLARVHQGQLESREELAPHAGHSL